MHKFGANHPQKIDNGTLTILLSFARAYFHPLHEDNNLPKVQNKWLLSQNAPEKLAIPGISH
jgi:hypothetical protein